MKKRLRWAKHQKRWFGKWHLYLGIFAGLVVAFVGVTGSILVFRDEIDRALNPDLFEVPVQQHRLPVLEVMELIQTKHPKLEYSYLLIPEKERPGGTYELFDSKGKEHIYINPYNGEICGRRAYDTGFIATVLELHTSLFIPVVGRYFVGLCSLILLILTISGLRLWIPKKWKQLRQMLTVKFSSGFKRQNYDWHNVIGFYTAPVVSILSLTGFLISFSILFIPLIFLLNGHSAQGVASLLNAQSTYEKNAVSLTRAEAAKKASLVLPGAELRGIASPANHKGSYRFDLVTKGFPHTGRRQMVTLDQYSGKVLLNSEQDFPEVGQAYLSWLGPLHYGSFGGLPTKIIALLAGLSPLVLFITGFIIWWPRWRKQVKSEAGKTTNEEVAQSVTPVITGMGRYFIHQLKKGLIYGVWMLLVALVCGMCYGLAAGMLIQPALFVILFCTLLITVNFLIAFILMFFNTVFFIPFKSGSRKVTRYFAWSLAIFIVFMASYLLITYSGIQVF